MKFSCLFPLFSRLSCIKIQDLAFVSEQNDKRQEIEENQNPDFETLVRKIHVYNTVQSSYLCYEYHSLVSIPFFQLQQNQTQ